MKTLRLWLRRRLLIAQIRFQRGMIRAAQVQWRVVLGTGGGVVLAALVYLTLASQRPAPAPGNSSKTKVAKAVSNSALLPRIQAAVRPLVRYAHVELLDSLLQTTAHLNKQDSSRRRLTLQQLLNFRRQVAKQDTEFYNGRNYLRSLNLLLATDQAQHTTYDEHRCQFIMEGLAVTQATSLAVLDSIQQSLAGMQSAYLRQAGRPTGGLDSYRLRLTQLQLSGATLPTSRYRHADKVALLDLPERPMPTLTELTRQKLALLNALELERGEAAIKRDAIARQLLDSCRREVGLLLWLDSCREQQSWQWHQTRNQPTDEAASRLPSATSRFTPEDYIILLIFTILALVPLVLAWLGWRQARRKPETDRELPTQEQEPPLLQLLLLTYAGHLRTLLRTPRQIKRFAGKVRLQYHLLEALAAQSAGNNEFAFNPPEQVLAFVLLLLLEESGRGSDRPYQDEDTFAQYLRDMYQQARVARRLDAELIGQFSFQLGEVEWWSEPANTDKTMHRVFSIALAVPDAPDENQARLLRQLYWLNTGLLV